MRGGMSADNFSIKTRSILSHETLLLPNQIPKNYFRQTNAKLEYIFEWGWLSKPKFNEKIA